MSGASRAATFYTLISIARLNDIEPEAYLRHVHTHIDDHPISRIDELLPWNVALDQNPPPVGTSTPQRLNC